jgi:hypothetical protein
VEEIAAHVQRMAQVPESVTAPKIIESEISATPKRAVPPAASAASIKAWMRPTTLRRQFILTELLQPPLAMREPRHL